MQAVGSPAPTFDMNFMWKYEINLQIKHLCLQSPNPHWNVLKVTCFWGHVVTEAVRQVWKSSFLSLPSWLRRPEMVPRQAGAMCQSCISSISSNSGSTQNTNWYKGTYCEVTLPSDSASFSRNSQKEHLQQNVIFPDYIKFPSIRYHTWSFLLCHIHCPLVWMPTNPFVL